MDAFLQAQIDFILAFQSVPGLQGLAQFFTTLGIEQFFLLLIPAVYLCVDPRLGVRLAAVLLLSDWVNGVMKMAFHLPRPYWVDSRVQVIGGGETSYGLPSGHAQNGTAVWLFLASVVNRPWAWAGAAALVVGISLSRLYLGVHFPMDSLAGWLLGGLFLLAYLRLEPWLQHRLGAMPATRQVALAFGVSLLLVLVGFVVRAFVAASPDPETWADYAREARSLNSIVADSGAFFGFTLGWVFTRRWANFSARGPLLQRLARLAIGLLVVGALYLGLGTIFPREPEAVGLPLRYLRYALMASAAVFAVPWLCLKLRLAQPAESVAGV